MTPSLSPRRDLLRMVDWSSLKSEFIWIYEGHIDPRYRDTRDHHQGQAALLLLAGTLSVENDAGRIDARAGDWVLPREGPRLQRFSDDTRVLSIHYGLYWPGNQPVFEIETAMVFTSVDFPQLEKQGRIFHRQVARLFPGVGAQLPWTQGSLPDHLKLQRAFSAWMCVLVDVLLAAGATASRLGKVDERILHAVQVLDELRVNVIFDEVWLAREVGLSASQLDRLFSRQFGCTPRQYMERRKLERAKDLIRSAPLSIKQIAYETGFRSLPYFSRWFNQRAGMSPRAFQKSVR